METIAVYWEAKIKTYGFMEKTDLALFRIRMPVARIAWWGERIRQIGDSRDGFIMAAARADGPETFQLVLLVDRNMRCRTEAELTKTAADESGTSLQVDCPVELVYFQGPHFGDRYGIADAAFGTLAAADLRVLAAGCTGASVYIVVPEKDARSAVSCLSERFVVPDPDGARQIT